MVSGLERVKKPCAVVDVDGTVIRGNSMHEMIRFMLREAIRSGNVAVVVRLLYPLVCRRMKMVTHKRMKLPIHRLAERFMAESDRLERLTERLMRMVNPVVMERINELRTGGCKIILATAAPEVYMRHLADAMSADCYNATPIADSLVGYIENRGEQKLLRAKEVAAANGWEICCVITDHKDDLPLLALPGIERILVSAADTLCDRLRELNLSFSVIR